MRIEEPRVELLAYSQLPPRSLGYIQADDGPLVERRYVEADPCKDMARIVERCGRVSWKSEAKMQLGTADDFMVRVVNIRKDQSIAEHASATILMVTDRYASHQIVRHRLAAYTQESTHYINYEKRGEELAFMRPLGIPVGSPAYVRFEQSCAQAERDYFAIIREGHKHYHARFVLPGALKTEIAVTYNLRMWKHFFKERCPASNTPEIVHIAKLSLEVMHQLCPPMFEDQHKEFLCPTQK